jgi:porin
VQQLELLEVKEGWLDSQSLLQLPDWMALGISFTAEPMLNGVGGARRGSAWLGQTALSLSVGSGLSQPLPLWREADRWSLNLNINHTAGDPDFSERIGALLPLQQVAYPSGFLLSELSLNRSAGDGWLALKAGIVPLNPTFIAAPVLDLYVHSAFNNTLNIGLPGLPINPYPSLGGIISVHPDRQLSLSYGWFELASTEPLSRWLGNQATPGSSLAAAGTAQLLQLNWEPRGLGQPPDSPLSGCRSGAGVQRLRPGCRQPVAVQNQLPPALFSLGGILSSREGAVVYGSATLRSGLPLGLDERLWFGAALSSGDSGVVDPSFVAGGLVVQGPLPSRPLDLLVLAAGRAGLQPGSAASGGLQWPSRHEAMLELGYVWQINRNLALQPTLQWILNPSGGDRPLPGIVAAGLQLSLTF